MLKKLALGMLLTVSTLATAQISLDLALTITIQETEHRMAGTVVVDENVITPIIFDQFEALIAGISAQTDGEAVILQTQFFQKTEDEAFEAATELFTVQVPFNEPATISINDTENEVSLVLIITPSPVE